MARKSDFSESFQTIKSRKSKNSRIFSEEDQARFEEMRTEFDDMPQDDGPPAGDRWSIWWDSEPLQRGPEPHPAWVITDHGAVDYELGVLKTGKEADVFLIERVVPGTDRAVILASKRYRSAEHTQFNRAGDYMAGRGAKRSRDARAMAKRTTFGLEQAAGRWAAAEFDALKRLYNAGVAVPYPVQVLGREVIMEFIGDGRTAAPRLAETKPDADELDSLWEQAAESLRRMTELGFAHGDLSPYNTVVHDGRLVVLDLPQVVDIYANPLGMGFLERDVENLGSWFTARGIGRDEVDDLQAELKALAAMP
ncbi:serine protein kinase RIO [Glycomyces algeriensis]|uniref:non-specific serine/threonine protein kinase n=1 Tax=Glycomyces algeriensis TaxID=256037 RepID=A0A9W6LJ29_9ACTN|nr:RIO1 family regulatory kinase/ATPase [Glycomyces algeriensis]MDA1366673.1 RIO-like kinase [Glycomyces algeriensis]MDR7351560.1 RIO kinase 1 [Glycomyces algeriensis]GLI44281.1 RIO kinase 1 [Glycomyces algeriensis]